MTQRRFFVGSLLLAGLLPALLPTASAALPVTQAPAPRVAASGLGISSLTWTWALVPDATFYNVYPSTGGAPIAVVGDSATFVGLATNTAYGIRVAGYGTSQGPLSATSTAYTLAAPPVNAATTGVFISSAALAWDADTDSSTTKYLIEYWTAHSSTLSAVVERTTETLTGLLPQTSYYVQIQALNGLGVMSTPDSFEFFTRPLRPIAAPAPAAPSALLGISTITWVWPALPRATFYNVYPSTGGTPIAVVTTDSVTFVGLATNTAYGIQVAGANVSGQGPLSSTSTAYTLSAPPTNAGTTGVFITSAAVAWDADTDTDTTKYRIEYWTAHSSTLSVVVGRTTDALTGLLPQTSYYAEVRALNGLGVASSSDTFEFFTRPLRPVAAPALAAPSALLGISTITWVWHALPRADFYNVYPSTGGTPIAVVTTDSVTFVGLATNTAYGIQVAGANVSGQGPLSSTSTTYTLSAPPTNAGTTGVFITSAAVAWNADTDTDTTKYFVEYWKARSSTFAAVVESTTDTLKFLLPLTTYYVRVRALNGRGIPSAADEFNFETNPSKPAHAPAPSAAREDLGVSSITWRWTELPFATSYDVYPSSGGTPIAVVETTSVTFVGLSTNAAYGIQVAGVNVTGQGPLSPAVTSYTLAAEPTGLALTQVDVSSAALSWSTNGNPAGTEYLIDYRALDGAAFTVAVATEPASVSDLLRPGTTYTFDVQAVNHREIATAPSPSVSTVTPRAVGVSALAVKPLVLGSYLGTSVKLGYNGGSSFNGAPRTVSLWTGPATTTGIILTLSLPPQAQGEGNFTVYTAAAARVRSLDLGPLKGGLSYYVEWDGSADAGGRALPGAYYGIFTMPGTTRSAEIKITVAPRR